MMNQTLAERFEVALQAVRETRRIQTGIGTLGEKTLHAVLKRTFEPYEGSHEVKIGGFVADIVGEDGIIEIQTRAFDRLRRKLDAFLPVAPVTVVYPVPRTKWLCWIDPETGETTCRRKSPKTGTSCDIFSELYKIKPYLTNPNLRLCIVLLDVEEYRKLDGWSVDKKKGSTRYERIPLEIIDTVSINTTNDYKKFLPDTLISPFTSKEFKKVSGLSLKGAQTALNVLYSVDAVKRTGKRGKLNLYESCESLELLKNRSHTIEIWS